MADREKVIRDLESFVDDEWLWKKADFVALTCRNALALLKAQETVKPKADDSMMSDSVNHPSHYADKQIEVIDYIRDTLRPDGFVDYCIGNVIKYVSRWRKKGGAEDLQKAAVYLQWAVEKAGEKDA